MAEKTLIANVLKDNENPEMLVVTSPVVGIADGGPKKGLFLNPFDKILTVKILNQRYLLRLPRDVHGRVAVAFIPDRYTPIAYNQPIVRLDPKALETAVLESDDVGEQGPDSAGPSAAGMIEVTAPSEGVFYQRPSPDSPAYVEVGSHVETGSVLGLVEVMKCFNQITYGGPGLPESGEVARILVADASEVQFGQVLFWIKP